MAKHNIAIIFDFDDTLVSDSITFMLQKVGVDVENSGKKTLGH
jgi:phosphoserine phosphatase